ncbi:MAG: Ig-like domain-containing protein [Gemmatimonadota bacterium]|nr:MAG: Ig-like domain-containing protein [Gemmatimonadota bacterium]
MADSRSQLQRRSHPTAWPAAIALLVLAAAYGCDEDSTETVDTTVPIASAQLNPEEGTLFALGQTLQLTAVAIDAGGAEVPGAVFTWSSSDESVASVSSAGLVTAVSSGSATITASVDGINAAATIWVDPERVLQNYCSDCHVNGHERIFVTTTCPACHAIEPDPASPDHKTVSNEHATVSGGIDLLGAHESISCFRCHDRHTGSLLFDADSQNDCIACHQRDYDGQHAGSGFPTTCLSCHNMDTWSGAIFDHSAASGGFELVGAHASLPCASCHDPVSGEPLYSPANQNDCIACHQDDYDGQHAGSGYPTTCLICHNTSTWTGASFDHTTASGGFELVGVHATLPCTSCHDPVNGEPLYDPADQNDCIACHQDDYDGQHAGSGYPTTCLTCHNTIDWADATFDHDAQYFPIFSGTHRNRWDSCATCHTDPNDYRVFTCFNCHFHNQTNMDNRHSEVAGYVYESSQCYACHPDGEAP